MAPRAANGFNKVKNHVGFDHFQFSHGGGEIENEGSRIGASPRAVTVSAMVFAWRRQSIHLRPRPGPIRLCINDDLSHRHDIRSGIFRLSAFRSGKAGPSKSRRKNVGDQCS
jgi:hypothetical protein